MSKQVIRLTDCGQVTIPKSIRQALRISPETPLCFRQVDSCIVIEPVRVANAAASPDDLPQAVADRKVKPEGFSADLERSGCKPVTGTGF